MADILTIENLSNLLVLCFLQAVLGFDNLLYISLESKRAPAHRQALVRRLGIGIAVFLRIALLLVVMKMLQYFQDPMFGVNIPNVISSEFNFPSLIVLLGGVFILYTATKEILHMTTVPDLEQEARKPSSVAKLFFLSEAI